MKRTVVKLCALLLMVGAGFQSMGKAVDVNTAQTTGSNFLISAGVAGVKSSSDLTVAYTASTVVNGSIVVDYYAFNVAGGKGFVMVSGDDKVIPILAYSNESAFDINNIAPATKDWIEGYKNEITAVITHNVPAKAGTAERWSELQTTATHKAERTTAVTPLLTTTWDQAGGGSVQYNQYCPNTAYTSGLSVTGCVATAMAQLMKFWNWPTVGCGSHTYYDDTSHATLTADFGNTAYGWSSMPTTSSNAYVATLMSHAGISVNMNYTANESGSIVTMLETYGGVNCAEYALKTYFHYKPSLTAKLRSGLYTGGPGSGYYIGADDEYYNGQVTIDSFNEATWISMLQTELNAGRPMLYEGQGPVGGHCWVCDGWETTSSMFHFNWGWSGSSNGYYTVDNLAPPALGVGGGAGNFNSSQGVLMGVQPDSFPSNTGNIKLLAHLNTTTSTPMAYGTPFTITTKVLNSGTTTFHGSFAVQVYDTASQLVTMIDSLTGQTITAGDSTTALTFNCNSYALIPLMYNGIRIASRPTGSATWTPLANNNTFINYTIMGVLNDTDIALYDSLHIGSHTILHGHALNVSTVVGNQGTGNYAGTLQAVLVNVSTGATYTVQATPGASIASYATANVSFSNTSITVPNGMYALEIQHSYNGSLTTFHTTSSDYYINPVLVTVVTAVGVPEVASTNDIYVYPNPAKDVMNILMQGVEVTNVRIMDMQGRVIKTLQPAPNHTLIAIPVSEFAAGVYFVEAQTTTGIITKKVVISK